MQQKCSSKKTFLNCGLHSSNTLPIELIEVEEEEDPSHLRPTFKRLKQTGEGNLFSFYKGIEMRQVIYGGSTHQALFATEYLPKGTTVYENDPLERETRTITRDVIEKFSEELRKRWWVYCWQLEDNRFSGPRTDMPLDDALPRDALNYINHSCDPNIGYDGDSCLVTLRDVETGEMICYDYAMSETDPEAFPEFECECGTQYCRGRIKPTDYLLPELQQRYKGNFLTYVANRQLTMSGEVIM